MTDEVVTPGDVLAGGARDKLYEAVIDAWMAKGAVESGATNLKFKEKDGDEWVYYLPLSGAGDPEVVCDSGGNWRQRKSLWWDSGLGNGTDYVDGGGDNSYEVILFDAPGWWDSIKAEVAQWIDPWVNDSPSPNVYTNQINSMARVADQLYVGNAPTQGGSGGGAPSSADVDLWDALTQIGISADQTSAAVDAFQETYASDIWKTIGGQQSLVFAAGLALTAEATAWNESYKSLRDFIQVAIHDFSSFAGSHGSSGEGVAAVLGATSTVAGILSKTVGKTYPPFASAMLAVTTGISVYQLMNPAVPAVADQSLVLGGDTYEAKMRSFKDQILKISADLEAAELAIDKGCQAMVKDTRNHPDNYSLTRGQRQGRQGDYDNLDAMLTKQIDISKSKLRKVAAACELIGDQQTGLGRILGGSDAAGNPSSYVSDEWYRGYLPEGGSIGDGYQGPAQSYQDLVSTAVDLLLEEGKTSHRVAEWVIAMVLDYAASDHEREQELDRLARQIDDEPLYRGNDPRDPEAAI